MSRASFRIAEPDRIQGTVTVTMPIEDWRRVRDHVREASDSHYGPLNTLLLPVVALIGRADREIFETEE